MTIAPTQAVTSIPHTLKGSLNTIRINGAVGISNANGAIALPPHIAPSASHAPTSLLAKFVEAYRELASYKWVRLSLQRYEC